MTPFTSLKDGGPEMEAMRDQKLKEGFWALFYSYYVEPAFPGNGPMDPAWRIFHGNIWTYFFSQPQGSLPRQLNSLATEAKNLLFMLRREGVYDFAEYIAQLKSPGNTDGFMNDANAMLSMEESPYRFVARHLAPLTHSSHKDAVELPLMQSDQLGLTVVRQHLTRALTQLSDKLSPNYRESVRSSLSAVAALMAKLTGNPQTNLGQGLSEMESRLSLHRTMNNGFSGLFGYARTQKGVAHVLTDDPSCDQDDARFMLVACSAFIQYLLAKAHKAGIDLERTATE